MERKKFFLVFFVVVSSIFAGLILWKRGPQVGQSESFTIANAPRPVRDTFQIRIHQHERAIKSSRATFLQRENCVSALEDLIEHLATLAKNNKQTAVFGMLSISVLILLFRQLLLQQAHVLGQRAKELNCLYGISKLIEKDDVSLEEIFQETVSLISQSLQYPEITCARIIVEGQEFKTNNFRETIWKQDSDIIVHGERIGAVDVYYLEERPEKDEGPFSKEEIDLIGFITQRLACTIQQRRAENALKRSHSEMAQALRKLKETQSQMLQSEKMACVGQLAVGVAHEINNPTGFVSSNLHTLSGYHKDINELIDQYGRLVSGLREAVTTEQGRAAILEDLDRIDALKKEIDIDFVLDDTPNLMKESIEGIELVKKIVTDLKNFAHPAEDKAVFADINNALESTLNIVWNELKYKANVIKEYGELPQVKCYPDQLNQVFANLLVNAAQSIEKRGKIKVTTRAIDGKVEINISDTGAGIPKETLPKIFDPSSTAKEVGKGTGLGLYMAYNIIKKHKGTIDVKTQLGKGTTFIISIPIEGVDENQLPRT